MSDFFNKRRDFLEVFRKKLEQDISSSDAVESQNHLVKCANCESVFNQSQIKDTLYICKSCGNYFRMKPNERLYITVDDNSFVELFSNIQSTNPLDFPNYDQKIKDAKKNSGNNEAFVCGMCTIDGEHVAIGVMDSYFMMGSMGSAVGEKIVRLIEYAMSKKINLIIFSASGGARMQEGMISLIQMAKTSIAMKRFLSSGLLYISVLTNPTTGGVSASFAMQGDYIIAEKNAIIGFAGKKVIEQTIGEKLPNNFQTSEFQYENGFVDFVLERSEIKNTISKILKIHH